MGAPLGDLFDALDRDALARQIVGGTAGRDPLPPPVGKLAHRAQDARLVAVLDRHEQPPVGRQPVARAELRSEEHTSELQSLMRNSSAVFCLKKIKMKTRQL